jgi:hypothetical protein
LHWEANQDPLQQNIKSSNKETRVCIGKQTSFNDRRAQQPDLQLHAEEESTHVEAWRMPGSGAGGGGREEPWRVVTLARRCLVALVRRCRAEEEERKGEGDRGFVNLRRRIKPIARMTARPIAPMRLAAHSPLAPPFSTSARE